MKRIRFLLVCLLTLLIVPIAFAEEQSPFKKLLNTKTIKCYLDKGAAADWEKGKLNIEITKYSKSEESSYITFGSIDIKNGKAKLIANVGSADVTVLATASGLSFIEETASGNLSFTTIFPAQEKNTEKFLFVQSRHIYGLFGATPIPQQYYGTCEILE
ncbi:MAG: hypothetical protein KJ619_06495 [Candidatus Omnitrophica bacterium]|nr:hypothetical protein [Candidatus Omnitrophota bacterium]MBU2473631.1 hypothetical protein [Candidatus Omnitrophota bacterium]